MKRSTICCLIGAVLMLSACTSSEKVDVLKSPCVGIDGSPCGPKRPMNGNYNPDAKNQAPQLSNVA